MPLSLLGLATLASAKASKNIDMQTKEFDHDFGVQLFTLMGPLMDDLAGTLRQISAMGYRKVELPSLLGLSAAELRKLFDTARLNCTSVQYFPFAIPGMPTLDGDISAVIDDLKILGAEYAVMTLHLVPTNVSSLPDEGQFDTIKRAAGMMTQYDWEATADMLNRKGVELQRAGLRIAYHNHNTEFKPINGKSGMQILLEKTNPNIVDFELDVGWAASAGVNIAQLLEKNPGRFRLMHVKDIKVESSTNFEFEIMPVTIGKGKLDWQAILATADKAGVIHYFIEQEPPYAGTPIDVVRKSLNYLNKIKVSADPL
jgi:sugar phosphate isomerase/epimerase